MSTITTLDTEEFMRLVSEHDDWAKSYGGDAPPRGSKLVLHDSRLSNIGVRATDLSSCEIGVDVLAKGCCKTPILYFGGKERPKIAELVAYVVTLGGPFGPPVIQTLGGCWWPMTIATGWTWSAGRPRMLTRNGFSQGHDSIRKCRSANGPGWERAGRRFSLLASSKMVLSKGAAPASLRAKTEQQTHHDANNES
jgi:hypothetical protein